MRCVRANSWSHSHLICVSRSHPSLLPPSPLPSYKGERRAEQGQREEERDGEGQCSFPFPAFFHFPLAVFNLSLFCAHFACYSLELSCLHRSKHWSIHVKHSMLILIIFSLLLLSLALSFSFSHIALAPYLAIDSRMIVSDLYDRVQSFALRVDMIR